MKKFDGGLSRLLHTDLRWLDVPERVQFKSMYAEQSSSVLEGILHIILRHSVDSVFAQPAVTFLCHVIVELLAVGHSLLLVRRRGTLYLTIYVICHVAIVIFGRFLKSILFSFY